MAKSKQPDYDSLFFFVNQMFTLKDEGLTIESDYEDANTEIYQAGNISAPPAFANQEEYKDAWWQFEMLAKMNTSLDNRPRHEAKISKG